MTEPSTRSAELNKKWSLGITAVLAAGVLAGTFAFASKINEPEYKNKATADLNVACGHARAAKFMDKAGVDSVHAMGIILKDKSQIANVCEVVNQSLSDILLENQGSAKTNNAELYELSDALGIDAKLASKVVSETYNKAAEQEKLRQETYRPANGAAVWRSYPVTSPSG